MTVDNRATRFICPNCGLDQPLYMRCDQEGVCGYCCSDNEAHTFPKKYSYLGEGYCADCGSEFEMDGCDYWRHPPIDCALKKLHKDQERE